MTAAPSFGNAQRRAHHASRHTMRLARQRLPIAVAGLNPTQTYDGLVLSQKPVMFLTMKNTSAGREVDATGHSHNGTYLPSTSRPISVRMPNGDAAAQFDGRTQYLEVPDSAVLSVPKTGVLTIQCWMRADTLQQPSSESTSYVNFLGKSEHGRNNAEYMLRLYNLTNTENPPRPNRVSAYIFNLPGGEGSGSYFQDPMTVGQWIMVTEVVNTTASAKYPLGYCSIYKNGSLRQTTGLTQHNTIPGDGCAPFRVGATDPRYSHFQGAIGKVAVFDYELTAVQVAAQYRAMVGF